jgi:hypothetical protein
MANKMTGIQLKKKDQQMVLRNIANIILGGRGTIFYQFRIHLFVYKYLIVVNFFPVTFCFESKFKAIERQYSYILIRLKSIIFYSHRKIVHYSHIFLCISIHISLQFWIRYLSKQI